MINNIIKIVSVAAVIGTAAGCAHNNSQLQSKLNAAMLEVRAAQYEASSAQSTANAAQSSAEQANKTAQQALKTANQAEAATQANNKRIERAFGQSQY